MTVLVNSLISNTSNFRNLALFICHLFIGGQFRQVDVLYDPKVFDDQFTTQFDSVCSVPIPWQKVDITQPSMQPPHDNDRTDHILQLIFFDPKYLAEQIDEYKDYFTFYRIFVLSQTTDEIETKKRISIIGKLCPTIDSNTLILHYDSKNGLTYVDSTTKSLGTVESLEYHNHDQDSNVEFGLFDGTFGKYEQMREITMNVLLLFRRMGDCGNFNSLYNMDSHIYFANYFFHALHAPYINYTCISLDGAPSRNLLAKHEQRKYHNELSLQYKFIWNQKLAKSSEDQTDTLYFSSYLLPSRNSKEASVHPLYPYGLNKVMVLFVYGADFERHLNIWFVPGSIQTQSTFIGLFVILAAIVLCVIRRKLKLRRDGLISTFIDTMVAFIGGGNLQMRHKLERWFFVILLFGAFFITSIFTGDLFDCVYRTVNQKIDTFEQLAETNSPIYVHSTLTGDVEHIHGMLEKKIGPKIKFNGIESFRKLVPKHKDSFIFIYYPYFERVLKVLLMSQNRDFDVIQESLGATSSTQFYLQGDHYVSDQRLEKIDKATSSFIENGFRRFFESFVNFRRELIDRVYQLNDDIQALTFEQLRRPMILVFYLWGIAIVILISEIIIFKWKNWRREHQPRTSVAEHPPTTTARTTGITIYRPCPIVRRFVIRK